MFTRHYVRHGTPRKDGLGWNFGPQLLITGRDCDQMLEFMGWAVGCGMHFESFEFPDEV